MHVQRHCVNAYGQDSSVSLENTDTNLVMYNKSEEKTLGKKRVRIVNPKNGKKYSAEFLVTNGVSRPLLASQRMQRDEEIILGMNTSN
jgi:hypothetical protein